MNKRITLFLFILLFPVLLLAQGRIKGKVVDLQSGDPLIGANVLIVGTTSGAATDVNGEFEIGNINPGVYEVRASFIGYQTITFTEVRVNTDLTTQVNFELPGEGIEVDEIVVIAERPLIQKDNTNKIRTTTSEDIDNLPVRGVNNIIGTTAGVVIEADNVFIRGGRMDEVGFYLEGVNIKNPEIGGRSVTIPQAALEEIQVQAGGYTAEYGGSNAGIIRQQLRTGTSDFKASFEYITDNIGAKSKDDIFNGEERLGAYWFGYNEMVATFSGPILDPRFKIFLNANYLYEKDVSPQPYPGISLGKIVDTRSQDSIVLNYGAGPVKNNFQDVYSYAGTVNLDLKPIIVRLTGTFSQTRADVTNALGTPVLSLLNPRVGKREISDGSFSAKVTHIVSPEIFYEVSGGLYLQKLEDFDPSLEDNYWSYGDSVANANAGWTWDRSAKDIAGGRVGRYTNPTIRDIFGFSFRGYGEVPVNYQKRDRLGYSANVALTMFAGKNHTIKLGGEFQQYILRRWTIAGQNNLAQSLNSRLEEEPGANPSAVQRNILITNGVNNYGYDVFGNELDDDEFFGPHEPIFASAYVQDKIEFEDIIVNAGLRFDYIDVDNKKLKDPSIPDNGFVRSTGEIIPDGWTDVPTFQSLSPRLGISFPVTDQTFFHAQFGKFVQQSQLLDIYQGYYRTTFEIRGGFFIPNPVGKDVRPTRTTQYEIGFTQLLTDYLSFDITGYYKDIQDQVVFIAQPTDRNNSAFQDYTSLTNGDFATTKGLEISLNMRRFQRTAINATLSLQDARGTGSFPNSNRGIVGAPLENRAYVPVYVSPLEYNNAVRGNVSIDYRFGANDGPTVLHDFGVSVLATFTSGHPYTRGIGARDLEGDARFRQPVEPLNSSTTPSTFQVDLRLDKSFSIYDRLAANIYIRVINLFDTKNVENVFLRTGSAQDDGVISDPDLSAQLMELHGQQWADVYRAVYIDYYEQYKQAVGTNFGGLNPLFYGPPRQIQLGIKLSY